jgi:hypothetical protein
MRIINLGLEVIAAMTPTAFLQPALLYASKLLVRHVRTSGGHADIQNAELAFPQRELAHVAHAGQVTMILHE